MKKVCLILLCLAAALLSACDANRSSPPFGKLILQRIDILPSPVVTQGTSLLKVAKGNIQPFVAIGLYSDGSSLDISTSVYWNMSVTTVATITPAGLLMGV
ncbi:hypothetical protein QMX34_004760, partial [Aeromonas hydrophila]|nr:hypothetical protein [Aeromonas hydrophila]